MTIEQFDGVMAMPPNAPANVQTQDHNQRIWKATLPRIPVEHLNSIVTLYKPHATTGAQAAIGTAFLVEWKEDLAASDNIYLVTCVHCHSAREARFASGEILSLNPQLWKQDPSGNDLMAMDVTDVLPEGIGRSKFAFLGAHIKPHHLEYNESNVGDEIYMLGLHSAEDNPGSNRPRARFGNISACADNNNPVRQGNGAQKPSHIGDMRSRGGFSGSPVFTFRDSQDFNDSPQPRLLGVHSDQFKERILIEGADGTLFGNLPSSMTIIVPAWNLSFIIDDADFLAARERREQAANL